MRPTQTPRNTPLSLYLGAFSASVLAFTLVACGGGGGDAGPASLGNSPVSASYTEGTLTGFGSIIVNGVRFDESSASVSDDAGQAQSSSALKLGMRLEVDSASVSGGAAKATAVRFGSALVGPVSAKDAAAQTVTVLGQTVDISATTVFDATLSGGLSAISTGAVLEIHGLTNAATGHLLATRVESESGATAFKLRGVVAALNTSAKTFAIGGAVIDYSGIAAANLPATLANGVTLRVLLSTTPNASAQWVATALGQGARKGGPDKAQALLRGSISAFTSSTSFSVNGLAVDASGARFSDGSAGLGLGVQVEVAGTLTNGVLVASAVELEAAHQGDDSRRFELHGAITALDTTAKTFTLRGVNVSYAGTVSFSHGTAADLALGKKVAVKGGIGSTRTLVQATAIDFE